RNLNVISSADFVQKESFLQLFLNPNDNLTIKFNNSLNQSVTLVIKNILGEDVERISIEPNVSQISIPTRKLGNGFYAIYIEELSLFVPFILY
ncbi:MAG: T9SS type A sorting domain-containing protein, partial [Candidatus Kapaibacteriota bacterium]